MNFRNGYDKHNDMTEDEYNERQVNLYYEETEPAVEVHSFVSFLVECANDCIEGEPNEDDCLPGIPDYDRFGRPSWTQ